MESFIMPTITRIYLHTNKVVNSNEQALMEILKLQKESQAATAKRNRRVHRDLKEKSSRNNNYLENDAKKNNEE